MTDSASRRIVSTLARIVVTGEIDAPLAAILYAELSAQERH
jgi:hypothetical protein